LVVSVVVVVVAAAVLFGHRILNSAEAWHNFNSSYKAVLFTSGFVVYCPNQECRFIRHKIDDAGGD
jgi:hypothetical protein